MSTALSTIYQLLESTDTQYRVFDMGRRVQKLSKDTFKAFEDATIPYPAPLQQKAWLAILFWDKNRSEQHYLWFLSFALDEQGKLIQATRNHFIAMVIEVLGTTLTGNGDKQTQLDNNPYTFKPDQNKLAMLNAQIKSQMNQNASVYYEHAQNYLRALMGWNDWQGVGLQGLADFAVRLQSDNNQTTLIKALPNLPPEVANPMLSLLEHIAIEAPLAEAILHRGEKAIAAQDKNALVQSLRAISHSKASGMRTQLLQLTLQSALALEADILIVIAARLWLDLADETLRLAYLEKLAAAGEDHQLFIGLVSDLVAIPAIRQQMLSSFRSTERSDTLASAIGQLFSREQ